MNEWNWRQAARCRTADADALFVRGRQQRGAGGFCHSCPVRTECLAYALDERIEAGVWGGMTERERRAVLRQRPQVQSWSMLLQAARTAFYTAVVDGGVVDSGAVGRGPVDSGAVDGGAQRRATDEQAAA
jgi:WhiB family redox-sensing transcriptional regulator